MNYSKFWLEFKQWALVTDEENLPYKLKTIVRLIRQNPDISLVKLAGYLEADTLYLARYLHSIYKELTEAE